MNYNYSSARTILLSIPFFNFFFKKSSGSFFSYCSFIFIAPYFEGSSWSSFYQCSSVFRTMITPRFIDSVDFLSFYSFLRQDNSLLVSLFYILKCYNYVSFYHSFGNLPFFNPNKYFKFLSFFNYFKDSDLFDFFFYFKVLLDIKIKTENRGSSLFSLYNYFLSSRSCLYFGNIKSNYYKKYYGVFKYTLLSYLLIKKKPFIEFPFHFDKTMGVSFLPFNTFYFVNSFKFIGYFDYLSSYFESPISSFCFYTVYYFMKGKGAKGRKFQKFVKIVDEPFFVARSRADFLRSSFRSSKNFFGFFEFISFYLNYKYSVNKPSFFFNKVGKWSRFSLNFSFIKSYNLPVITSVFVRPYLFKQQFFCVFSYNFSLDFIPYYNFYFINRRGVFFSVSFFKFFNKFLLITLIKGFVIEPSLFILQKNIYSRKYLYSKGLGFFFRLITFNLNFDGLSFIVSFYRDYLNSFLKIIAFVCLNQKIRTRYYFPFIYNNFFYIFKAYKLLVILKSGSSFKSVDCLNKEIKITFFNSLSFNFYSSQFLFFIFSYNNSYSYNRMPSVVKSRFIKVLDSFGDCFISLSPFYRSLKYILQSRHGISREYGFPNNQLYHVLEVYRRRGGYFYGFPGRGAVSSYFRSLPFFIGELGVHRNLRTGRNPFYIRKSLSAGRKPIKCLGYRFRYLKYVPKFKDLPFYPFVKSFTFTKQFFYRFFPSLKYVFNFSLFNFFFSSKKVNFSNKGSYSLPSFYRFIYFNSNNFLSFRFYRILFIFEKFFYCFGLRGKTFFKRNNYSWFFRYFTSFYKKKLFFVTRWSPIIDFKRFLRNFKFIRFMLPLFRVMRFRLSKETLPYGLVSSSVFDSAVFFTNSSLLKTYPVVFSYSFYNISLVYYTGSFCSVFYGSSYVLYKGLKRFFNYEFVSINNVFFKKAFILDSFCVDFSESLYYPTDSYCLSLSSSKHFFGVGGSGRLIYEIKNKLKLSKNFYTSCCSKIGNLNLYIKNIKKKILILRNSKNFFYKSRVLYNYFFLSFNRVLSSLINKRSFLVKKLELGNNFLSYYKSYLFCLRNKVKRVSLPSSSFVLTEFFSSSISKISTLNSIFILFGLNFNKVSFFKKSLLSIYFSIAFFLKNKQKRRAKRVFKGVRFLNRFSKNFGSSFFISEVPYGYSNFGFYSSFYKFPVFSCINVNNYSVFRNCVINLRFSILPYFSIYYTRFSVFSLQLLKSFYNLRPCILPSKKYSFLVSFNFFSNSIIFFNFKIKFLSYLQKLLNSLLQGFHSFKSLFKSLKSIGILEVLNSYFVKKLFYYSRFINFIFKIISLTKCFFNSSFLFIKKLFIVFSNRCSFNFINNSLIKFNSFDIFNGLVDSINTSNFFNSNKLTNLQSFKYFSTIYFKYLFFRNNLSKDVFFNFLSLGSLPDISSFIGCLNVFSFFSSLKVLSYKNIRCVKSFYHNSVYKASVFYFNNVLFLYNDFIHKYKKPTINVYYRKRRFLINSNLYKFNIYPKIHSHSFIDLKSRLSFDFRRFYKRRRSLRILYFIRRYGFSKRIGFSFNSSYYNNRSFLLKFLGNKSCLLF